MNDIVQKQECQHCGRQLDPDAKSVGNYARAGGLTPEIVEQAASETGLDVYVGPVTHGNDPDEWFGIWRKDERNLDPCRATAAPVEQRNKGQ